MVESRSCDSTNAIPPQWQFRRKITQNRRDSTTIIPLICDSTTIIPHGGIIVVESPKLYQRESAALFGATAGLRFNDSFVVSLSGSSRRKGPRGVLQRAAAFVLSSNCRNKACAKLKKRAQDCCAGGKCATGRWPANAILRRRRPAPLGSGGGGRAY